MTIFAAAISTGRKENGEPDQVLLGISDRMVTSDDIEFEAPQTKIFGFAPATAFCLAAGDTALGFMVATETHQRVIRENITDVLEIARLFAANFASLRRVRAEAVYLAPLGLDVKSFVARQHQMQPESVSRLEAELLREDLGVEAIIAGVDSTGPHIYQVTDPGGHAICYDREGFCAIGSGGRQFETQFMNAGYTRVWHPLNALLLMFSAKRKAEVSPGVGPGPNRFRPSHLSPTG